jgi:endo-1,4-beta-D-glucanase Y
MTIARISLVTSLMVALAGGCGSDPEPGATDDPGTGGTAAGGKGGSGGKAGGGQTGGAGVGGSSGATGGNTAGGPGGGKDGAAGGDAGEGSNDDAAGGSDAGTDSGPPAGMVGGPCPPNAAAGMPRRPFPQHAGYPGCPTCIHPTAPQATLDADVGAYYDGWKSVFKKINVGDISGEYYVAAGAAGAINGWPAGVGPLTQSEGHGYGMMALALMAGHDPLARTIFDSMNRVRKAFPSSYDPRLMSWVVPKNGSKAVKPQPPATDGDFDMAYALLLAHDQWGDEANSHYLADALTIIGALEEKIITKGSGMFYPRLNIGDPAHFNSGAPESLPDMTRPSDFIVDHMRAFGIATGKSIWLDVENGSLNILKAVRNPMTGLVPDFVAGNTPQPSKTGTADEDVCYACYDYNSCRVPWRQATAITLFGAAGSKDVADKLVTWARTKYNNDPAAVGSSFKLDGTAAGGNDNAFSSPLIAASVVNPANQAWLDKGWTYMKGSDKGYYSGSITLFSMLTVSGNWWVPSGNPACQ